MKRLLVFLPIVLVLAACGGSGSDESGGGGDAAARAAEEKVPGEEYTAEYQQGISSCTTLPMEQLARDYGVKAKPETVARAVAKSIEPTDKKKQDRTYRGCLTVLKAEEADLG